MIATLANFNTIQETEIIQGKFSDHNAVKMETSNQTITRKFSQVWRKHMQKKTIGSRKKGLRCKGTLEEPQKAAVIEDRVSESGAQPWKSFPFPLGLQITGIKNKEQLNLMWKSHIKLKLQWKQQQQKENLADKKKLEKEREALCDKAPPKPISNLYPWAVCGPGWL